MVKTMETATEREFETHDIRICVDCLMFTANGELADPDGDLDAHVAAMEEQWPSANGWDVIPTCDDEGGFSWSQCDGCGSRLGGDRFDAVAMREVKA